MARVDPDGAWATEQRASGEDEVRSLLSNDSEPEASDIVVPKRPSPMPQPPRRQSSFAQNRPDGTPRTPNRVRFEMETPENPYVEANGHSDGSWLEEEDYISSNGHTGRRNSDTQRLPLLTDIEAPSVTLATDPDFDAEELLARPKSNMQSAFMNMANSIM